MTQVSNGIYGKLTVIRANGDDANFFPLNELENTLGRDPACLVHLRSWNISRLHARIVFDADTREATIIDSSVNGTLLNSQLLTEPALLKNNDVIELGQRSFRFEKADPISASKMVSIRQKLKNSPGFFKKHAETGAELPPTPRKTKTTNMPMQKMLFKDLISAKYADKDLESEKKMDSSQQSSIASTPINSSQMKKMSSPSKASPQKEMESLISSSHQKKMDSPASRKMGFAQRVKLTPNSAPRSVVDKVASFKKSLSMANTPKGPINFLKQLKDAKKIVKTSSKVTVTTPKSSNNGHKASTPKHLLSSRQTSVKKTASACQSVAKSAQSVNKNISILDASKDAFFEHVQDFVGIPKIVPAADDRISPESEINRRKSVSFGPPLEPEIFDKRNAPSSPLTRGEPAPQLSSKDGTPTHKSILKVASEEKKSTGKRKLIRMSNAFTGQVQFSSPLSKDALMLTASVPPSVKSTKSILAVEEDIPFFEGDAHDGLASSSVEGDVSLDADILEESLLLEEAVDLSPEPKLEPTSEPGREAAPEPGPAEENLNDGEEVEYSVSGAKDLLKTHQAFYEKEVELSGLSTLFDSTQGSLVDKAAKSKAPSSMISETPDYTGVKQLLKTPKPDSKVSYLGLKETLKTPAHDHISSINLVGVKELLHTPKDASIMSLVGVKETLKTPKPVHTLNLEGVKELLETPDGVAPEPVELKPARVTRSLRSRVPEPSKEESASRSLRSTSTCSKTVEEKENNATVKSIPASSFYAKSPVVKVDAPKTKIPKKEPKMKEPKESKIPQKRQGRKRVLEEVKNVEIVSKGVENMKSKKLKSPPEEPEIPRKYSLRKRV